MQIKYFIAVSASFFIISADTRASDAVRLSVDPVHTAASAGYISNGFYIGAEIGGLWGRVKESVKYNEYFHLSRNRKTIRPDGFISGFYAGYNFLAGDILVLGVETDLNASGADARFINTGYATYDDHGDDDARSDEEKEGVSARKTDVTARTTAVFNLRQKWTGATRVRAGIASGRFMPYLAAGIAYGKFNRTYAYKAVDEGDNGILANEAHSEDRFRKGWTAGFGLDYAITDNILLRAEYRYTDLGSDKFAVEEPETGMHSLKYTTDEVRLGLAYRF